jgi:hypothetical protein
LPKQFQTYLLGESPAGLLRSMPTKGNTDVIKNLIDKPREGTIVSKPIPHSITVRWDPSNPKTRGKTEVVPDTKVIGNTLVEKKKE